MDKLQALGNELHLPNATGAAFEVGVHAEPRHLGAHQGFHFTQCGDHGKIRVSTINKGGQHAHQRVLRCGIPRHRARFHHRVALPLPTLLLVIHLKSVESTYQRTAVPVRPESHIHAKGETIFRDGIQQANHHLPQPREIGLVVELLAATFGDASLCIGKD